MGGRGGGGGGPQMQFNMVAPVTPVVKALLIANVAIWVVLQLIVERLLLKEPFLTYVFGLVPNNVITKFFVWEFGTYMFLHSGNPFHIVFNMLMLWWLGGELEQRWGSKFFLVFYLVSGIGAAVFYTFAVYGYSFFFGPTLVWTERVVGASGAIFGLLFAYGVIFGERIMYFMMLFPMRAKYFVMILGGVEIVTLLSQGGSGDVANLAHVGGLASGFLFLRGYTYFQQRQWRKQSGRRGRGLKLVVNNDGKKDDKDGPRYWN